jgi:hypothetical protein
LTIKNDLKTYFEKKTEGAIIRSKACWLREGERNSNFFFNSERRNYINKSIQTLVTDSGHTVLISYLHMILFHFNLILEFRHHSKKICQLNEHLNYLLFLYLNKVSCKICFAHLTHL